MNREELMSTVREIISREAKINTDNIELDTELMSLDIDSLDMMKVALALEKSFDITITTAELAQIRTFGDVINGLESKITIRGQPASMDLSEPGEK